MARADPPPSRRSVRAHVAGIFKAVATDDADFARMVARNTEGDRFFMPHPKAPPEGTHLLLEVVARESRERICAVEVVVKSVREQPTGMMLGVVHIEPGCGEDVRRELACSQVRRPPEDLTKPTPVIGIDLGTTYTCAAIVDNGEPKVIRSRLGYNTIPSMLTFDPEGIPIAGQVAERRLILDPDHVIYGSKRLIGRTYSKGLVSQLGEHMRYGVAPDDDGMVVIKLDKRIVSPTEVAACILAEIKKVAEQEIEHTIRRAVITVPAAFTENQRAAVRTAAQRAGFDLLRLVNEPTAAALAFGYGAEEQKTVIVYDLGGGTFDVSILSMKGSVYTVLATAGDMFLGGVDFDQILANMIHAQLAEQFGSKIKLDRRAEERVASAAREAKHALSELHRHAVTLPNFRVDGTATPTIDFHMTVTREEFEAKAGRLVDRTIAICEEALRIADVEPSAIQDVLLVGGQTRMPLVTERVQAVFKRKPSKRVHPDEVVALGASILATAYEQPDAPVLTDVLPLPIGVAEPPEGLRKVVLQRNVPLPAKATLTLEVEPGAPLEVAVFQGDALRAGDNEFLGAFVYPAPIGSEPEQVVVSFELSADCVLTIQTKLLSTGEERLQILTTKQTPDQILERIGKDRVLTSLGKLKAEGKSSIAKLPVAEKGARASVPPKAAGAPRPGDGKTNKALGGDPKGGSGEAAGGGFWAFLRRLAFWKTG